MGICMGKDSPSTTLLNHALSPDGRFTSQFESSSTTVPPPHQPTNSQSAVRFSEPRVPVIFILGGPGSGKITHCDRVVQERAGLAHVNMTDLVQQHVIGNGLDDFTQMPASNLVQVLQMEMKMAVNATGYLISGYPRSMRDVVEYNEKLRRVDAVILLNWHIKILEKQIEFGSQLGDTVLALARMELRNYGRNVLSVAEYYDQMKRLVVVDGERQPTEVYADFLRAIDNVVRPPQETRGGGAGAGMNQVNVPPPIVVPAERHLMAKVMGGGGGGGGNMMERKTVWVIGGPGSNKSHLSSNPRFPWKQCSIGSTLRSPSALSFLTPDQITSVKNTLRRGELVSNDIVLRIVLDFVRKTPYSIIDGFPRNLEQKNVFERETNLQPPCLLIDCSEVELGRSLGQRRVGSRTDNNSEAIKSRLTTYRLTTLPMLKQLDDQQRLHIVDGDGDPSRVMVEFTSTLNEILNALEYGSDDDGQQRKPSTDTIKQMYTELLQE